MRLDLTCRTAVVSAGAAGIGLAIARAVSFEQQRDYALSRVSMRTMVEAEDIAKAALFLASDAGRYVSNVRFSVGGNVEGLS